MELIAVAAGNMNMENEVQLNAEQIRLGDIRVDTVGKNSIGDKQVLTGVLNFNQQKLSSISARVEGRVQKLYVKDAGEYVHKGERLYDLYSEPLNNARQEYVAALEQQESLGNATINYGAIVESARNKLLLWGITEEQIKQLGQNKQGSTLTTVYSKEEGYATTVNVKEGDYVAEGGMVLELADLSMLWAEAQVYTTQLASFDKGSKVTVQIPDLGKSLEGTIDFVNPEADPDTRITLMRVTIPNSQHLLHPGMPVYMLVRNREHLSMTLPREAILTDGSGSTVWLQKSPGVYVARRVKTGRADGDRVEIISGVRPGEVVVTSGAYLVNSEYIFESGSVPGGGMAGMKM
jgi:Cu(I)/Ag(I) efflux system membrane fusion protein